MFNTSKTCSKEMINNDRSLIKILYGTCDKNIGNSSPPKICIKQHLILRGFCHEFFDITNEFEYYNILWLDYCAGSRWFYDLHGVFNLVSVSFWQFTLWQSLYDKSMKSLWVCIIHVGGGNSLHMMV